MIGRQVVQGETQGVQAGAPQPKERMNVAVVRRSVRQEPVTACWEDLGVLESAST